MDRLRSIADLEALHNRITADRDPTRPTIVIAAGTCGQASGPNDLIRIAKRELLARELTRKISLRITGCHGFCEMEPSVLVEPCGTFCPKVSISNTVRILDALAKGKVLEDLLFADPETGKPVEKQNDIPFFGRQARALLARNQKVDPTRIYDYIANGGYAPMAKVLTNRDREW